MRMDETVHVKCADGEKKSSQWWPTEGSIEGKKYVGRIFPSGKVVLGDTEPVLTLPEEKVKQWQKGIMPSGLNFAYEREGKDDDWMRGCRVRFSSGRTYQLFAEFKDKGFTHLYRMRDGRYLINRYSGCGKEYYRVDAVNETVDCSWEHRWIPIPEGVDELRSMGEDEGRPGMYCCKGIGQRGPVVCYGNEKFSDEFLESTYLGHFGDQGQLVCNENKIFVDAFEKANVVGANVDGEAENKKFFALYSKVYTQDAARLKRHVEVSPDWEIVDHGHHVCAYRILHAGNESCEIRMNLSGKPGSCITAKRRCRNPNAMYAAAAQAMIDELERIKSSGESSSN